MRMSEDVLPSLLFSYGTLQLDSVQLASFGRLLEGEADALPGWLASHSQWRGNKVTSRATTPNFGRPTEGVAGGSSSMSAWAGDCGE